MSPGTSLVTKETKVDESIRAVLLQHKFFVSPNPMTQDTFIKDGPMSEFDQAVLDLLNKEGIDYSNKLVEYWFQSHNPSTSGLMAHCDYNFIYREKMRLEGTDWPHRVDRNLIVSPITLAVYLEVSSDMEGGELCISQRAWWEDPHPLALSDDEIKSFPYESIIPIEGQILYFKGSEHYHWVNRVTNGTRKSMLINFWPKELLDK